MADQQPKSYTVGYKKPPVHSRFKKGGPSPNPRGRPKGARSLKADLLDELAERLPISENGKQRKYSKQRITLKALVNNGIKGDVRAASKIIDLLIKLVGAEGESEAADEMSTTDAQILASFLERHAHGEI